jgi:AraC-like DNA-binding protein
MPLRVGKHERSVHPLIARAAMLGVRRHRRTGPVAHVDSLLRAARPVPEALHHELLAELAELGWASISAAATHVLDRPRDPEWAELIENASIDELLAAVPSLQRRFHAGHTTDLSVGEDGVTVTHRELLGGRPASAESLFLAAVQQVVIAACIGRRPPLTVTFADGTTVDEEALARSPLDRGRAVVAWRIHHRGLRPEPSVVALLTRLVTHDPARTWTLPAVAAQHGLSPRTLQRRLAAGGTTFQATVIDTRLVLARALIERTSLGLAAIAAACGFTDHAHLTHRFSRRYGVSPSSHRDQRHPLSDQEQLGVAPLRSTGGPSGTQTPSAASKVENWPPSTK